MKAGHAAAGLSSAHPGKSVQLAGCRVRVKTAGGVTAANGGQVGQTAHGAQATGGSLCGIEEHPTNRVAARKIAAWIFLHGFR